MTSSPESGKPKRPWLWLAGIVYLALFLATRLINIRSFPLYIDETTHIFLAKSTLAGDVFVGLRETGKQVYIWLVAGSMQIFQDPILAGRLVSVLAGLVTAWICYQLAERLYPGRRIGIFAGLFYLLSPFAVMFDRIALADGMLTMLMGGSLLAGYQLWRRAELKWAVVTGLLLGLAAFTKGYALFFYPAPLLMWLLLGRTMSRQRLTTLLTVTYATASIAWLLMFSIGWHIYERELSDKSIVGSEDSGLVAYVWSNAVLITDWLTTYLTWPVIVLLLFAGVTMIIKRDKPGWVLLTLIGGSVVAFVVGFTELNSRYLFPLVVPFSVVVGWAISELARLIGSVTLRNQPGNLSSGLSTAVIFLAICLPALIFSYQIVMTPYDAPLPEKDKADYIVNAQSLVGYQDVAQSIDSLLERYSRVTFLRHGLPSPLEVILSVYLSDKARQHLEFVYIRDLEQITPQSLDEYALQAPTLTVKNDFITANAAGPDALTYAQLWPLASFSNPDYPSDIDVYQWLLPPDFAIHWFQQGGDAEPRIAWWPDKAPVTASNAKLIDGATLARETPEAFQQALIAADVEYILATPELVSQRPGVFGAFMDTDGTVLSFRQLPPGWRLAFAYPDLKCKWCLFQIRSPDYPTNVNFADTLELEGYDLARGQAPGTYPVHVTLYWHSLAPLPGPYEVFVHVLNEDGQLVAQVDEAPLQGTWPTDQWQAGSRLADRHTLQLDPTLAEGVYTITVGLYDPTTLARLPVKGSEKVTIDNAVAITTITLGEGTASNEVHALN